MTAAIVFDLDGTLVDSLADIANAVNRMLVEDGQTALPHEIIRGFVGNGLPKLVERVI
ncbi:MAG: HAD hydrolase-like protein, partial [Ruegeria sp.]